MCDHPLPIGTLVAVNENSLCPEVYEGCVFTITSSTPTAYRLQVIEGNRHYHIRGTLGLVHRKISPVKTTTIPQLIRAIRELSCGRPCNHET